MESYCALFAASLPSELSENQLHRRGANRLAADEPLKSPSAILPTRARMLGRTFGPSPAHRIDNIGLAAPLGPTLAVKIGR